MALDVIFVMWCVRNIWCLNLVYPLLWMQLKASGVVSRAGFDVYTQHLVKMIRCIKDGDREKFIEYFSG